MVKKDYDALADALIDKGMSAEDAIQVLIDIEFERYTEKHAYLERLLEIKTRHT